MEIEYRHFKPGDENGLADVFNFSFQSLGGGFLRTPKSILWRYINRPGGDPREIQVAVDSDTGKIVGNVCSTIEHQRYGGQTLRTGAINDVAVLPEYRKYKIARHLMDQAIDYMKTQNCEISVLCADAKGHPRSKLYLPLGWQDYAPLEIWYRLIDYNLFCRYVPGALLTVPPYLLTRPIYWLRSQHMLQECQKKGFDFVDFTYNPRDTGSTKLSRRLWALFNEIAPQYLEGHTHYSLEEWKYFRETPIIRDFLPTYSIVTFHGEPVGFISFCRQFIYASKLGIRFPLAFTRDIVLDRQKIAKSSVSNLIYSAMIAQTSRAAIARQCVAIIFNITRQQLGIRQGLAHHHFAHFAGSTFMARPFKKLNILPNLKKPVNVSAGDYAGYP